MHLPELALLARGQRRFVRQRRFLVHRQRVVFEGEAHLRGIGGQQLLHHRRGFGAVGTLEVAELDQADGRRGRPPRGRAIKRDGLCRSRGNDFLRHALAGRDAGQQRLDDRAE